MTREEFKKLVSNFSMNSIHCMDNVKVISINNFYKISDVLCNDFESRICENCKYTYTIDEHIKCGNSKGLLSGFYVEKDFGCNQFKRKDK